MKKHSNKSLHKFVVGLPILWWEQAILLLNRIKNLLQNKQSVNGLVIFCIVASLCVGGGMWAINSARCDNCKRGMGSVFLTRNRNPHFRPCGNCEVKLYMCPPSSQDPLRILPNHPHQTRCSICERTYWNCPLNSDAGKHGESICKPPNLKSFKQRELLQRQMLPILDR